MDPTVQWLLGLVAVAAGGLASWALREVVALRVIVAEQGTHGRRDGADLAALHADLRAMRTEVCGCLAEQGKTLVEVGARLGALEVLARNGTRSERD